MLRLVCFLCKLARHDYLSLKHQMLKDIITADQAVDERSQKQLKNQPKLLAQLESELGRKIFLKAT